MENLKTFYSYSPITGKQLGPYKNMTRKEVNNLIERARVSQKMWYSLPLTNRLAYLIEMRKVLVSNAEKYAKQIHIDNGKSMTEALTTEIVPILSILEYYIKKAKKILKSKKVKFVQIII